MDYNGYIFGFQPAISINGIQPRIASCYIYIYTHTDSHIPTTFHHIPLYSIVSAMNQSGGNQGLIFPNYTARLRTGF